MRMFFYPLPRMPFIETRMPTVGDFYESLFPTIWEREIHQHYTYVLYPNHHEPSQIHQKHPKTIPNHHKYFKKFHFIKKMIDFLGEKTRINGGFCCSSLENGSRWPVGKPQWFFTDPYSSPNIDKSFVSLENLLKLLYIWFVIMTYPPGN